MKEIPLYRLIFFHIIITLFIKSNQQTYKITNENNSLNTFIITVCIGKPKQCFPFQLSTSIRQTMVFSTDITPSGYQPDKSETYRRTNTKLGQPYGTHYILGSYFYDTLTIEGLNIEFKDFRIVLAEDGIKSNNVFYGILGLGNTYRAYDTDISFLSRLFNSDLIKYQTISLNNRHFYIGNNPLEIQKLYTRKTKRECDLHISSDIFHCYTKNVMLYNDKEILYTELEKKLYVEIDQLPIYVPVNFFSYLVSNVFNVPFGNGDCKEVYHLSNKGTGIKCNEIGREFANNIKLIFFIDQWSMSFNLKNLFDSNGELYIMKADLFVNEWRLGQIVLNKYFISFDKENNKMVFNTNEFN